MTSPATGAEGAGQVNGSGVQPTGGSPTGGQGSSGQQGGTGHPAWQSYLEQIPAGLHSAVTPAFQKWDQDMSAKLNQVQQQYAPFQGLLDQGHSPENITGALDLVRMIQEDPQQAVMELAQWAGLDGFGGDEEGDDGGQGDGELDPSDEDGEELPGWAQQLIDSTQDRDQMLDLLVQKVIQDGQEAELVAATDQLEETLTPLLDQAGIAHTGADADTDALDFIFGTMQTGATPEQAVGKWTALQAKLGGAAASQNAPRVLPAGGGLPTQQVDPKSLSTKDRRALAVQRIKQLQSGSAGG